MADSLIEPLKKQMHEAEMEVDAIECKIHFADLTTTSPDEYEAMRTEQEQHRQHVLEAKALIDDQVEATKSAKSENELHHRDLGPGSCSEGLESDSMKTSQEAHGGGTNTKRLLIVAVAALVTAFAGMVCAQSPTPVSAAQVDQPSQTKRNQKISKQKLSATKASKAQNKKSTSSQDAAYAAAYKAGIPHSNTPASPK